MEGKDLQNLIRKTPFEPIEIGLSDGRSITVRHPDQVVIARRHVIFGLAQVRRPRGSFATPASRDTVARDWMLVDLMHVVSAEPANGHSQRKPRRKRSQGGA